MPEVAMSDINKVVLAYSGGLDTSVITKWLQTTYHCKVVTFTADIGQGEEVEPARAKAMAMGIEEIYIETFGKSLCLIMSFRCSEPTQFTRVSICLVLIARPLIAKRLVEIGAGNGADAISHGATGKGNDQVRFELGAYALSPRIR